VSFNGVDPQLLKLWFDLFFNQLPSRTSVSLFEYLTISFSLVLSFGVIRIIAALPVILDKSRRDWIHSAWTAYTLLAPSWMWWNLWSYHTVSWNYFSFLSILAAPVLFLVQVTALVPTDTAAVTSWREYFETQVGLFFGASAAWWLLAIGNSWLLLGVPLTSPTRLIYVAVLGGFLYAAFRPSRRLHAALAIIVWVSVFPVMGTFFLAPDRVGVMP
jgi:hypothetical protein